MKKNVYKLYWLQYKLNWLQLGRVAMRNPLKIAAKKEKNEKSTTRGIPRRSPIRVLTTLDVA